MHTYPLHSNLVLFKSNRPILTIYASTLYIPIWFYSNKIGDNLGNDMSSTFTFQSGSIQIVCLIETNLNLMSLHSNLVLFKLIRNACSSMSPPTFTFQSGSIQIRTLFLKNTIFAIFFTFQSGSIQMKVLPVW